MVYDLKHPRQKAINDALVKDVIIKCGLPLSIVDHPDFRHFLHVMDPLYVPVARSTITSVTIPGMMKAKKELIRSRLAEVSSVSVTTDIWSDRKMRSFLGVTAHTVTVDERNQELSLQSYLLACERVHGRHSGENIAMLFESCVEEYLIKNKILFVITDNASNMRKAFQASFPREEPCGAEAEDSIMCEEDEVWEDLMPEDQQLVDDTLDDHCTMQRLSCFTHSLQLVIKDGLEEAHGLSSTLGKVSRTATLLHTSTTFKDRFEAWFGNVTIPSANATRWNSTLKQVQSYVQLDSQNLASVLQSEGHQNILLSPREYGQLKELIEILEPFLEATNLTQGEKIVTVSVIVPCVLSLCTHLQEKQGKVKFCGPLVRALERSLKIRFVEIFQAVQMPGYEPSRGRCPTKFPFTNAFFVASVLDPAFGFQWLEHDVELDSISKGNLKNEIKGEIFLINNACTAAKCNDFSDGMLL